MTKRGYTSSAGMETLNRVANSEAEPTDALRDLMRPVGFDKQDVEIARQRIAEIEASPETVLRGVALKRRLKLWQK